MDIYIIRQIRGRSTSGLQVKKKKNAERRGELHIGGRARGYGTRRGVGPVRELCVRLLGAVPCAQQAAAERAVKLKYSVQLSIENMHFGDVTHVYWI